MTQEDARGEGTSRRRDTSPHSGGRPPSPPDRRTRSRLPGLGAPGIIPRVRRAGFIAIGLALVLLQVPLLSCRSDCRSATLPLWSLSAHDCHDLAHASSGLVDERAPDARIEGCPRDDGDGGVHDVLFVSAAPARTAESCLPPADAAIPAVAPSPAVGVALLRVWCLRPVPAAPAELRAPLAEVRLIV